MFWAFSVCERVFSFYLRKLVKIDAIHLCDKYFGVSLMTTIVDGNGKIILVGFAIAKVECGSVWEQFLEHLKRFFTMDPQLMSIVSNKHRDIISAVSKVYPIIDHAFGYYHLYYNIITYSRDKPALGLILAAARATYKCL